MGRPVPSGAGNAFNALIEVEANYSFDLRYEGYLLNTRTGEVRAEERIQTEEISGSQEIQNLDFSKFNPNPNFSFTNDLEDVFLNPDFSLTVAKEVSLSVRPADNNSNPTSREFSDATTLFNYFRSQFTNGGSIGPAISETNPQPFFLSPGFAGFPRGTMYAIFTSPNITFNSENVRSFDELDDIGNLKVGHGDSAFSTEKEFVFERGSNLRITWPGVMNFTPAWGSENAYNFSLSIPSSLRLYNLQARLITDVTIGGRTQRLPVPDSVVEEGYAGFDTYEQGLSLSQISSNVVFTIRWLAGEITRQYEGQRLDVVLSKLQEKLEFLDEFKGKLQAYVNANKSLFSDAKQQFKQETSNTYEAARYYQDLFDKELIPRALEKEMEPVIKAMMNYGKMKPKSLLKALKSLSNL